MISFLIKHKILLLFNYVIAILAKLAESCIIILLAKLLILININRPII